MPQPRLLMRTVVICLTFLAVAPLRYPSLCAQSADTQTAVGAADARAAGMAATGLHCIDPATPEGLRSLLRYDGHPLPIVSAHRGGSGPGLPENCIRTFEATLTRTFAFLEIDPRLTSDGAIVVHHDATLDRTTTGTGPVREQTLRDIQQLALKDPAGQVVPSTVPTLDEILEWARGKTVLVLDQKDVSVEQRVRKIEEHRAEAYALLIVYSFRDAQTSYRLNRNIMLEVMIPRREQVLEFDATGVPWSNVIAFVGHTPPDDPELYRMIHQRGARCLVGSSRNLDRVFVDRLARDPQLLLADYRNLLIRGADLIETDLPREVGTLLYSTTPVPEAHRDCFIVR